MCRIDLLTIRQIDDEDAPRLVLVADGEAEELVQSCQAMAQEHRLILKECDPDKGLSLFDEASELSAAAIIGGSLSASELEESTAHWFPTQHTEISHHRLTPISKPVNLRSLLSDLSQACDASPDSDGIDDTIKKRYPHLTPSYSSEGTAHAHRAYCR